MGHLFCENRAVFAAWLGVHSNLRVAVPRVQREGEDSKGIQKDSRICVQEFKKHRRNVK